MSGYGMSIGCQCCGCTIFDMRIASNNTVEDVEASIEKNSLSFLPLYDIAGAYFEIPVGEIWESKSIMPEDDYYLSLEFTPESGRYKYEIRLDYDIDESNTTDNRGIVFQSDVLDGPLTRIRDDSFSPFAPVRINSPFFEYHTRSRLFSDWTDDTYEDGKPYIEGFGSAEKSANTKINVFDNCVEIQFSNFFNNQTLPNRITELARLHRPRREILRARVKLTNTGTIPLRFRAIGAFRISDSPTSECLIVPKHYQPFALNEPLPIQSTIDTINTPATPRQIFGGYTFSSSAPFTNGTATIERQFEADVNTAMPMEFAVDAVSHQATVTPLTTSNGFVLVEIEVVLRLFTQDFSLNTFSRFANEFAAQQIGAGPTPEVTRDTSEIFVGQISSWRTRNIGLFGPSVASFFYSMQPGADSVRFEAYQTLPEFDEDDPRRFEYFGLFPYFGNLAGPTATLDRSRAFVQVNPYIVEDTVVKTVRAWMPAWDRGQFPNIRITQTTEIGDVIGRYKGLEIIALETNDVTATFPLRHLSSINLRSQPVAPDTFGPVNYLYMAFANTPVNGFVADISYVAALKA